MRREPAGNTSRQRFAPELARYSARLRTYLEEQALPFIDLSGEHAIRQEHFADYDHLSAEGRRLFTRLLAERLEPLLPPPRGPGSAGRGGSVTHDSAIIDP